jgi:hypothetical protein
MRRTCAYTVLTPAGVPRISPVGLVAFTRTLAAARAAAIPGDTIQGWSNGGMPRTRWTVSARGTLSRVRVSTPRGEE